MARRGPGDGVEVELRDGSWAQVRQIRPDDREALKRGFERLSPESRYRRFLTPMEKLTESQLTYLTDVDHHDHEAMVALDLATPGEVVGVGRYVRETGAPGREAEEAPGGSSDRAEAAVTVADDWQGKGLGSALTQVLAGRAAEEGITAFSALLLAGNDRMSALLGEVGRVEVVERDGDSVSVDVPIDRGVADDAGLKSVLRAVAVEPIELARAPGTGPERPARP